MKNKIIFTLLLFLSIYAIAEVTSVLYQASGISRFKLIKEASGLRRTSTLSQNYDLYREWSEVGGEQLYLVSSKLQRDSYLDADHVTGSLSWSVRRGPHLETQVWGKSEVADSLRLNEEFGLIVTGLSGCCDTATGYRLYDIASGKLMMSFNDFSGRELVRQPFSLQIPNSPLRERFVGALLPNSSRDLDFKAPVEGKARVMILKYGTPFLKQKLQVDVVADENFVPAVMKFVLERDPSVANSDKIEIRDERVELWNIDGASTAGAVEGVIVKIVISTSEGQKVLRIPIKGDRLHLASAEIPAGVQIRSLSF